MRPASSNTKLVARWVASASVIVALLGVEARLEVAPLSLALHPLAADRFGLAPTRGIETGQLALELAPARQSFGADPSVRHRRVQRAAGLGGVRAVGEPARPCERIDLTEGLGERVALDQPDAADPRGVDQHASGREHHELPPG